MTPIKISSETGVLALDHADIKSFPDNFEIIVEDIAACRLNPNDIKSIWSALKQRLVDCGYNVSQYRDEVLSSTVLHCRKITPALFVEAKPKWAKRIKSNEQ